MTAGTSYTFSIDSRSEAENVPSEVFYDNISLVEATTASTTELGLQWVQLYPNPASSMLHITAPVAIDNVQVYNELGKEVAGAAPNQVDVSGLTNGFYIVKMTSGEASISKSFIKE